jgi:hypothetical protein
VRKLRYADAGGCSQDLGKQSLDGAGLAKLRPVVTIKVGNVINIANVIIMASFCFIST